jgi:hypothetical protein
MGKRLIFIPVGIIDISRGTRSDSDDHPRLGYQTIRTPEGVQEESLSSRTFAPSATPAGGEFKICDVRPRVVVAFAPRPGANFSDPSGIKQQANKVESLKALDFSRHVIRASR